MIFCYNEMKHKKALAVEKLKIVLYNIIMSSLTTVAPVALDVAYVPLLETLIDNLFSHDADPIKETAKKHDITKKELQALLDDPESGLRKELAKRINGILENTDMEKLQAFEELKEIAFSNISDFLELKDNDIHYTNWDELDRKQLAAISEVRITHNQFGSSIQLKLHNKMSAIDSLAKIVKLMDIQPQTNNYIYNDNRLFSNIEDAVEQKPPITGAEGHRLGNAV